MLTDTEAKNAKAKATARKLADREGLYLYVGAKSGSGKPARSWRYDYRLNGRRETLTLGRYPELSLADARDEHAKARKLVAKGESPAKAKQAHRERQRIANANSVKAVCERWYGAREGAKSQSWRDNARRWLDEDVYPAIGTKAIQHVTADELEGIIHKTAKERGAASAHHLRLMLADVYSEQPRGLGLGNPARDIDSPPRQKGTPKGKPIAAKHIPALIEAIERAPARQQTKLAARLLLLTFTRKAELVRVPWAELDLPRGQWEISAERMKADRPHIVPLSQQAITCFELLKPLAAGSEFVFPNLGSQTRPMSDTTLNKFFHDIGYGHFTPHSARSTASTILNGQGFSADAVELQLAHVEKNRTRAAYNYADKLDERKRMMQSWADHIDALCSGGNVVPMKGRAA